MYAKNKTIHVPWQKRNYEQNVIIFSGFFLIVYETSVTECSFFLIHSQHSKTKNNNSSNVNNDLFSLIPMTGTPSMLERKKVIFITSNSMLDRPTYFYLDTVWSNIK